MLSGAHHKDRTAYTQAKSDFIIRVTETAKRYYGKSILKIVEITNISENGLWIILKEKEYFMPYSDFPWFKNAKIIDIFNVKLINEKHIYWPALDVDLDVDSIENLEKYPLIYK
jgi:hypothetical protein